MMPGALPSAASPGDQRKPWEALALTAALPQDRARLAVLLDFDRRMERIVERTKEAMLGQMSLAWWRDSLGRAAVPGGDPIHLLFEGEPGNSDDVARDLVRVVNAWETQLLAPEGLAGPPSVEFAQERGEGLFRAFAGADIAPGWEAAAHCWAICDRGGEVEPPDRRVLRRWARRLRPLAVLTLGAAARGRVAALGLSWFALTGR